MPCDTRLKPRQTIKQRAAEVKKAVEKIGEKLVAGTVKVKVSPQGAIVFEGLDELTRDGVTDNCAYRRIMATGSTLAKHKIAIAEQLAGRTVDKQTVAQGLHSHDGGQTWHYHKK